MTAIVILNVVFAALVVGWILSLLGWAIVTDPGTSFGSSLRAWRTAHPRASTQLRRNAGSILDHA